MGGESGWGCVRVGGEIVVRVCREMRESVQGEYVWDWVVRVGGDG